MELICGYYGAKLRDTVAFGDSMNDLAMMKAAGISIAMGNACEKLKEMADRVCESVWRTGYITKCTGWDFCKMSKSEIQNAGQGGYNI